MVKAAIFVSNRLQRVSAAFLCLMLMQLALTLANCEAEPAAMVARGTIAGR